MPSSFFVEGSNAVDALIFTARCPFDEEVVGPGAARPQLGSRAEYIRMYIDGVQHRSNVAAAVDGVSTRPQKGWIALLSSQCTIDRV